MMSRKTITASAIVLAMALIGGMLLLLRWSRTPGAMVHAELRAFFFPPESLLPPVDTKPNPLQDWPVIDEEMGPELRMHLPIGTLKMPQSSTLLHVIAYRDRIAAAPVRVTVGSNGGISRLMDRAEPVGAEPADDADQGAKGDSMLILGGGTEWLAPRSDTYTFEVVGESGPISAGAHGDGWKMSVTNPDRPFLVRSMGLPDYADAIVRGLARSGMSEVAAREQMEAARERLRNEVPEELLLRTLALDEEDLARAESAESAAELGLLYAVRQDVRGRAFIHQGASGRTYVVSRTRADGQRGVVFRFDGAGDVLWEGDFLVEERHFPNMVRWLVEYDMEAE